MRISSLQYLLKEGARNIWSNRTMSFASVGVLISCLLLTGAAILFSMNVNNAMEMLEADNSIRVILDDGLPTLKGIQVGEEIKKLGNIAECEFLPKDEAIRNYLNGDETLLQGLTGKDNPLPDAFLISLSDLSLYDETIAKITALDGVQKVDDYSEIADKLTSLDKMVTIAGFWIILLLSLVSLFIIANTIRVTMFSRRLEISIMKSVGATNWFVRFPFIVEGIIIGLFSGGISSLILILLYNNMVSAVVNIVPFFVPVEIGEMLPTLIGCFIAAGILFGAVGGAISIGRYLRKEGGDIVGW